MTPSLKWILGSDDIIGCHGSWEMMPWLWWISVDDDTMVETDPGS